MESLRNYLYAKGWDAEYTEKKLESLQHFGDESAEARDNETGKWLYFAYGSNMNRHAMASRVSDGEFLGVGELRGYRFELIIDGYATVVPDEEKKVFGTVWLVSDEDLVRLDDYENVDNRLYDRKMLPIYTPEGLRKMIVYVSDCPLREGPLGNIYMRDIINTGMANNFPEYYLAELRKKFA